MSWQPNRHHSQRPLSCNQIYHRYIVPTPNNPRWRRQTPQLDVKFGWETDVLEKTYETSSSRYGKLDNMKKLSRIYEKPLPHTRISYMKEHQSRLERDTVGWKRELTTETRDKYRRIKSATRFDTSSYLFTQTWVPNNSRTDKTFISIEDYSVHRQINPYISKMEMDYKRIPYQKNNTISFWNFQKCK